MEDAARESTLTAAQRLPPGESDSVETTATATLPGLPLSEKDLASEVTDIRPMRIHAGQLTVIRGADSIADASFPIFAGITKIGRGDGVDLQIPELGVSRLHAEVVWEHSSLRPIEKTCPGSRRIGCDPGATRACCFSRPPSWTPSR